MEVDFGPVAAPGLTNSEFIASICVTGSFLPKGTGTYEYAYPDGGAVPIASCNVRKRDVGVMIEYDAATGDLTIDATDLLAENPVGRLNAADGEILMSTLELRSESGVLALDGLVDATDVVFQDAFRFVKQDREGFATANLRGLLPRGLSESFLANDLSFDATFIGGHTIESVDVVANVPEPTSATMCLVGFLCASISIFRRRA